MKTILLITFVTFFMTDSLSGAEFEDTRVVLVVHGGAGVRPKATMTPALKARYAADLTAALKAGRAALDKEGGTSLDAVETAVKVLEDSPLFNAGKGAVFTHEGRIELDASIMEGKGKNAGAVAGVTRIKNPVSAARAVMEKSPHVMMVGEGAERFAIGQGIPEASPVEFWTEERWKELLDELEKEKKEATQKLAKASENPASKPYLGTVGAVALDKAGSLAAATSTGGMLNKRHGRVGDSPIIGAGTYADNEACAISGTGHGEIFIRFAVASDIVARTKYGKAKTAKEAAKQVLAGLPEEDGGVGGVIGLTPKGEPVMEFNTEGMYRGTIDEKGVIHLWIYDDEVKLP